MSGLLRITSEPRRVFPATNSAALQVARHKALHQAGHLQILACCNDEGSYAAPAAEMSASGTPVPFAPSSIATPK